MPPANTNKEPAQQQGLSFEAFRSIVLADYRLANESRQASLLGRKEVLTGKAKFGIFGDGKEVAQLAMAKTFRNGDFRSGYYRDQTFMMAAGLLTVQEFFAQLYAHPDVDADPSSAGRLMNGHFATRLLDDDGHWYNLMERKNSSSDISPTAGQMPRLVGLAYASRLYRNDTGLATGFEKFTDGGNEVAFGSIGDASTSEGLFLEAINAAGVLQIPMAVSVWDDGYGISVPSAYQTTKQNISDALRGYERTDEKDGILILDAKGWDYPGLCAVYEKGIALCRKHHIPVLFHIIEMTQPQGHSTSGSHERYKSPERLQWEERYDCIRKMREWILQSAVASDQELDTIEQEAVRTVREARNRAWQAFQQPIRAEAAEALARIDAVRTGGTADTALDEAAAALRSNDEPVRKDVAEAVRTALRITVQRDDGPRRDLAAWYKRWSERNEDRYDTYLYSRSEMAATRVAPVPAEYGPDPQPVDGREILLANWDAQLAQNPAIHIFGEDVGRIGGVNQTYAGLQEKYGEYRIVDTGIREMTIIGQGIGMALRGLRPVAEIQYLDYLVYALTALTDDLACLHYRTRGGQKAPLIVSTRGHRLEGVWHSGSPMQMLLGSLRGMHVVTPRNMTQAAGFYNTLLAGDEPALVIEPLNAYRIKENKPANPGLFRIPLGIPDVLAEGEDLTIVTYGSCVRLALEAGEALRRAGIGAEIIDVQTLMPFDREGRIVESLKKTSKILFVDEDVPGGGTAYMMQQVIERQDGFRHLDQEPVTLPARDHRPAYGTDGDYFSKPSADDIFDAAWGIMHRDDPRRYPALI